MSSIKSVTLPKLKQHIEVRLEVISKLGEAGFGGTGVPACGIGGFAQAGTPVPPKSKKRVLKWLPGSSSDIPLPKGVALFPLQKHRDERGYFMEVLRFSLLRRIRFTPRQISVSETQPGVIKAFHFHERQADLFCPLVGRFRIVLLDGRLKSATCGYGYSIYTAPAQSFVLYIPPQVAHGYQVLSNHPGLMLYVMNREYDPSDEHRVAWDDSRVGFPWNE